VADLKKEICEKYGVLTGADSESTVECSELTVLKWAGHCTVVPLLQRIRKQHGSRHMRM
jgi:hypothetical protein